MPRFAIDPDIRNARTIASEFYTDPAFFEESKEKIFARSWHFLGPRDDVDILRPVELLPGFLNESVLVVSRDNEVRCVSNVCTHRGMLLVEEACRADLIRCRYHGRRFSLDGKFLSMPEFEEVNDFPSSSDDLRRFDLDVHDGLLFCSIEPSARLSEFCAGFEPGQFKGLELRAKREYPLNAHWALYCENYLEGFHIPYVHRKLNEVMDFGTYRTEIFRYSSVQTGYDADGNVAGRYVFIFPNLMFNFYPWGVSVNVVRPVTPDYSVIEFLTYSADEKLLNEGAGGDLHGVEMEDEAVVESVQKGIRSRYYTRGRYSPTREQGTHHFHRLIAEFLG